MVREAAQKYFRGERRYNCAQAILKAVENHYEIGQDRIDEFKAHGGGNAENGVCGALYAAQALLEDDELNTALTRRFRAAAGSTKCEKIRKLKQRTCAECVGEAADFMATHIEGQGL